MESFHVWHSMSQENMCPVAWQALTGTRWWSLGAPLVCIQQAYSPWPDPAHALLAFATTSLSYRASEWLQVERFPKENKLPSSLPRGCCVKEKRDGPCWILVRRDERVCKRGSFRGVSRSKMSGRGFLVYIFQGPKCSQQVSDLVITGPCSWAFGCLWHLGMIAISDWRNWKLLVGNPRGSWAFGAGFQLPVTLSCFLSFWEHHGV